MNNENDKNERPVSEIAYAISVLIEKINNRDEAKKKTDPSKWGWGGYWEEKTVEDAALQVEKQIAIVVRNIIKEIHNEQN